MPKKHGFSHAFAGMLSTLLGGILIRITSEQVLGLDITKYFGAILNYLPIKDNVSPETFTMSIFVFILCFVWGVLFYYFHDD
jgi:hypothetical protein